jgi:hypothetical protein
LNNNRLLIFLQAFLAGTLVGCSQAAVHAGQDEQARECGASHQADSSDFEPRASEFSESSLMGASIEDVFRLLGPVRDTDWRPGWEADVIWSESGFAEGRISFRVGVFGSAAGFKSPVKTQEQGAEA